MNLIVDYLANFFLTFTHREFLFPVVVIGYIWFNKKVFYQALCLMLTSLVLNYALKITFKVPLAPTVGKGFAFPSGHTQSPAVFYGWITLLNRNKWTIPLLLILLPGIGASLVHFGYHDYYDVIGGWAVAAILIMVGYFINVKNCNLFVPFVIITSLFLMIYINYLESMPKHVWDSIYVLLGLTSSEKVFGQPDASRNFIVKLSETILCLSSLWMLTKVLPPLTDFNPLYLTELPWVVMGGLLPLSTFIVSKMKFLNRVRF